jgi:hypothetical protein
MKEKLRRKHASLKIPPTIEEENTLKYQSSKVLKKKTNPNAKDEVYIRIGSEHLCKPNCDGCKNTFYKDKTKPKFKLVIHKNKNLDYETNEPLDIINSHRLNYIQNMIEKQAKMVETMSQKELESRKREIVVAIHDAWVNSYIENVCIIDISDRPELIDSRFVKFFNHNIIIVDKPVDSNQIQIDYFGLCWLYHFEKNIAPGAAMDAIVSLQGWKYFLCMQIGIEFYEAIKNNKTMYNLYSKYDTPFTLEDIHVVSKEFGLILFPLQETIKKIPEYIEHFSFWSKVPPEIFTH